MRNSLLIVFLSFMPGLIHAQVQSGTPLFSRQEPLNIKLGISFKELKKETNDSTYMDGVLYYEKSKDVWDSLRVDLRTRGDFRLRECFFSPIRVKIKKKDAKGTLFEGNKSLKLVLPCKKTNDNNMLVLREFICYKIYETLTPYTFNTRLLSIDLFEGSGKTEKEYSITGFFIEDDDLVAERNGAEVKEKLNLHPLAMHDTTTVRHDLFQYFIANIDWSTTFMHNNKIIQTREPFRSIPLTYDFDQSGFVDAPYAVLNPEFTMTDVKQRVYRGFCRKDNAVVYYVRSQFIDLEPRITDLLASYESQFDEKDFASTKEFVTDFFEILKDDKKFAAEVINKCRSN